MNALEQLRTEILATATAATEITAYDHVPGRANLPCMLIVPGTPYLEQGATFGDKRIRFAVVLLTAPGLNADQTAALDTTITTLVPALEADGWVVESVTRPQVDEFNQAAALATEINLVADATL